MNKPPKWAEENYTDGRIPEELGGSILRFALAILVFWGLILVTVSTIVFYWGVFT